MHITNLSLEIDIFHEKSAEILGRKMGEITHLIEYEPTDQERVLCRSTLNSSKAQRLKRLIRTRVHLLLTVSLEEWRHLEMWSRIPPAPVILGEVKTPVPDALAASPERQLAREHGWTVRRNRDALAAVDHAIELCLAKSKRGYSNGAAHIASVVRDVLAMHEPE